MQEPIIINSKPVRPPRRSYTKQFKIDLVAQCERGEVLVTPAQFSMLCEAIDWLVPDRT